MDQSLATLQFWGIWKMLALCMNGRMQLPIEKGKEQSQTFPLLSPQYSRFLYMVLGRAEKAREVLDQALERNHLSKPLLEALIRVESIQSLPKQIHHPDSLVEKFVAPGPDNTNPASYVERLELSSIFLEVYIYIVVLNS